MNKYKFKNISFFNKITLAFILSNIIFLANAQNYNWKAKIKNIENAGYYKIFLNHEITSELKHSFPDLRILDSKNNEIQYILKKQKTVYDNNNKTELKIVKNKHKKNKHYTEVEIENNNFEISNLIFKIVNTHNPIFVKIYGSEKSKKWFVLKNVFPVVPEITEQDSTEIKIMNIPNNNFKFLKVIFYDYDIQPITVTNVYFHGLADVRAEYVQLKSPKITQKDTLDKSIVNLTYEKPQFIDMISLGIKGPEFYIRKVQMHKKDTISTPYLGEEYYDLLKKDFYIGSLKSNRINLFDYKAKEIELIIENKDNQPLKIYKANSYQLKNYLVTYLKPDEEYLLIYGNRKANFPSYDLPYFVDTIPNVLPETYIYNIQKIKTRTTKMKVLWDFPISYVWYSIGALLVILLIISLIILKERFGKKGKTE